MSGTENHSRLTVFAIALFSAWIGTAATCGDISGEFNNESPGESCVIDQDCDEGVCVRGGCAETCVTDEDCPGGVCRTEFRNDQDDVVDVCVDDSINGQSMECRFDSDCDEFGEDARCGVEGTCFVPELQHALLVRDLTEVDTAQTPEDGGFGADIAAIYLFDPQTGEPTAWAEMVEAVPANDVVLRNAPDGSVVALDAQGTCTQAPYEQVATPLGGDDGYLLVRFLDKGAGRTTTTPPEQWNVAVIEWDDNCPGGELGESDIYEVRVCSAAATDSIRVAQDCERVLGSGSGMLEFSP